MLLLPSILSTSWSQNQITRLINTQLVGTIAFKELQLSWLGSQTVKDLELRDENGELILSIDQFSSNHSLFDLLLSSFQRANFEIKELNGQIREIEPGMTNLQKTLKLSPYTSPSPSNSPLTIHFNHVNGKMQISPDTSFVSLFGSTSQGDLVGQFAVDLSFDRRNSQTLFSVKADNFPVELLDQYLSLSQTSFAGIFKSLIGENVNFTIDHRFEDQKNLIHVNLSSPNLATEVSCFYDQGQLFLKEPAKVLVKITPEFLLYVQKLRANEKQIHLTHPLNAEILIEDFHLTLYNKPQDLAFKAFAKIDNDYLLEIKCDSAKEMTFRFQTDEKAQNPLLGNTLITGKVEKKKQEKQLHFGHLFWDLQIHAKHFPVKLACHLACLDDVLSIKLQKLFDNTVNADIYAQGYHKNGLIQAKATTAKGHVFLDGTLTNGILSLNQNFVAQFTLDKIKEVFGSALPFSKEMMSADQPLTLIIEPKDCSIPLDHFNLSQINIHNGSLNLGKVKFRNKGQMAHFLNYLHIDSDDLISVWFTPLYFSMKNGVIHTKRHDLLMMERYHLAAWGKVNLNHDEVHYIVALPGFLLANALQIKSLEKNEMIQIPLKGNLGHLSVDMPAATANLSTLVSPNQGGIFGSLLQLMAGNNRTEDTPPPTTNPLPWHIDKVSQEPPQNLSEESIGPTTHKRKRKSSLQKNVEKILENISR